MGLSLVTTAMEQTWPEKGPVIFLGEWCRLYSRRERWLDIDHEVAPYHWNDPEKLREDQEHLSEIYEETLLDLAECLNGIHGTTHSLRYWRIVLGPWLRRFVDIIFDRWMSIVRVTTQYEIDNTICLLGVPGTTDVPDTQQFLTIANSDEWNHAVYNRIIESQTSINIERVEWKPSEALTAPYSQKPSLPLRDKIISSIISNYSSVARRFIRDTDAVLYRTYTPRRYELAIQAKLWQVPILHDYRSPLSRQHETKLRDWSLTDNTASTVSQVIRDMVPVYLPQSFLEHFEVSSDLLSKQGWPDRPKLIWTSNAHQNDDPFKMWSAAKIEQGTKFVIGQHGGRLGIQKSNLLDHELSVCDGYLSWGWGEENDRTIYPTAMLKMVTPRGKPVDNQGGLTLVTLTVPRYALTSDPQLGGQRWSDYFDQLCEFVQELPSAICEQTKIRLYPTDYDSNQRSRWLDRFRDAQFDSGLQTLDKSMVGQRIVVSTYCSTTYLESIAANIPTIVFWDPSYSNLLPLARSYIDVLENAGMFHNSARSAAEFVAMIWDDVGTWWESADVVMARRTFSSQYCHMPKGVSSVVKEALRSVVDSPGEYS